MTTPPATSRAEISFTGLGNENNSCSALVRSGSGGALAHAFSPCSLRVISDQTRPATPNPASKANRANTQFGVFHPPLLVETVCDDSRTRVL